eukprot:scaffold43756_cov53-Phaeocystis_antarctica.AAC.1
MYDDRVIAHLHGPVARNHVRVEQERQPPLDGAQISPWGRVEDAAGVVEKTPGCLARGAILVGHHQVHPEVGKHALHGQPVSPMNSCESHMLLYRKRREAWGHASHVLLARRIRAGYVHLLVRVHRLELGQQISAWIDPRLLLLLVLVAGGAAACVVHERRHRHVILVVIVNGHGQALRCHAGDLPREAGGCLRRRRGRPHDEIIGHRAPEHLALEEYRIVNGLE